MSESILGGLMTVGGTYLLTNKADPGRALNVWSNSTYPAANLSNVCLWTKDTNDTAQHWKLVKSGGHYLLKPVDNENVALDLYTGSGSGANCNAHLYTPSQTSWLTFELAADDRHIKIRLENTNKYLTANPNQNGTRTGTTSSAAGNVCFWQGGLTDGKQEWTPRRVGGGSGETIGQKLILPINRTRLTASFRNSAYRNTYGYSHHGIDQVSSVGNTTIYASGIGTLIAKGWDERAGNVVVIKYPNALHHTANRYEDVIFRYYHLASINENIPTAANAITTDTVLGQYGRSGMGSAEYWPAAHLHVEADTDTAHPCYSPTFGNNSNIIKVGTSTTCYSALEFLHCKTTGLNAQTYSTAGNSYINSGDDSIPLF